MLHLCVLQSSLVYQKITEIFDRIKMYSALAEISVKEYVSWKTMVTCAAGATVACAFYRFLQNKRQYNKYDAIKFDINPVADDAEGPCLNLKENDILLERRVIDFMEQKTKPEAFDACEKGAVRFTFVRYTVFDVYRKNDSDGGNDLHFRNLSDVPCMRDEPQEVVLNGSVKLINVGN